MSSSSMRIINSSSTTRIRLAGPVDCGCVADVILQPPMDTSVEPKDHVKQPAREAGWRAALASAYSGGIRPRLAVSVVPKGGRVKGSPRLARKRTPPAGHGEVVAPPAATDRTPGRSVTVPVPFHWGRFAARPHN